MISITKEYRLLWNFRFPLNNNYQKEKPIN